MLKPANADKENKVKNSRIVRKLRGRNFTSPHKGREEREKSNIQYTRIKTMHPNLKLTRCCGRIPKEAARFGAAKNHPPIHLDLMQLYQHMQREPPHVHMPMTFGQ
jgi:hypothetical protein